LPEGAVGGVARCFEVAAEGLAHLIPPLARLLLGGGRGGDRAGTDHSQQRILDGVVNTQTAKADAVRGAIVHPGPAAAVARDAVLGACVLQRQLAPAPAAAEQPGEESVAMLGRAVMPAGGSVVADHFEADYDAWQKSDLSARRYVYVSRPILRQFKNGPISM
jgi:hypothetical protein